MQHQECGLSQNVQKLLRVSFVTGCLRFFRVTYLGNFWGVCIRYPILSFGATWIAPRMSKVSHARLNATASMGLGQIVQKLLVGLLLTGPPFALELKLRSRISNFAGV